jgi:DNA-binding NarL/FixJ family response regulator
MPTPRIRVLLVDDHQLLTQSLAVALRAEGLHAELADLTSRERLIGRVRVRPPQLVLLDLDLGGLIGDGATLVRPFTDAGSRVLVVSGSTDREWLATAVEQGAIGLVAKSSRFDALLGTVLAAAAGAEVMDAEERHRIVSELRLGRERARHLREPFERLTPREQEVLAAVADGRTVTQIAKEWFLSESTVRSQVRGILTKLDVGSQLEAVALALKTGWLVPVPLTSMSRVEPVSLPPNPSPARIPRQR